MQLNRINGNTYYIDNPTNIGVFIFKSKYCLLIDTGINNNTAGRFDEVLDKNSLKPKYIINTHNHVDHAGGNSYFKEHYPGAQFFTSPGEKLFIENNYLFTTYVFGTSPIKDIGKRPKEVSIDMTLNNGIHKIGEERFEIIRLAGHSLEQIGIATPDRVLFMGDSLFSENIMEKYTIPFLFDVEEQLKTIESVKTLDYEYYLLSHGDKVYDQAGIIRLADENKDNIENCLNDIRELLNQPMSREEVLEQICVKNSINLDFRSYHLCLSAVGALIVYLYNQGLLEYEVENGKLYYYIK